MLEKIGGWSPRMKLITGGSAALAVIAGVALVASLMASGSGISDSAPCEDFVRADQEEQSSYLESKLNDPTSTEEIAYVEGMGLNCSKGYPNSTVAREFEATHGEVAEVEAEGGSLTEGIALIRERTEGREVFGEITEELEDP